MNYQFNHQGVAQSIDTYTLAPDNVFHTNSTLDYTLVRVNRKCSWLLPPIWPTGGNGAGENGNGSMQISEYSLQQQDTSPSMPISSLLPNQPNLGRPPFLICTQAGQKWGHLQLTDSIMYAQEQRVNIIQHPRGRRKEVALQDNAITNIYSNVVLSLIHI